MPKLQEAHIPAGLDSPRPPQCARCDLALKLSSKTTSPPVNDTVHYSVVATVIFYLNIVMASIHCNVSIRKKSINTTDLLQIIFTHSYQKRITFSPTIVWGKTDFSRVQHANFYRPDFRSAVCRGCGSINLRSESVMLSTSFSMKFESFVRTIATKAMSVMNAREAINFGFRKLGFN